MNITKFIATGLGSGFLPKAPGTWGSLLAVFVFLFWAKWSLGYQVLLVVIVSLVGIYAADQVAKEEGKKDPKIVVIDEIAGQFLALIGLSPRPLVLLSAFFLFRILDILKPPPVRQLERLPGGLGIMADDLMAGLLTNVILRFLAPFLHGNPGG